MWSCTRFTRYLLPTLKIFIYDRLLEEGRENGRGRREKNKWGRGGTGREMLNPFTQSTRFLLPMLKILTYDKLLVGRREREVSESCVCMCVCYLSFSSFRDMYVTL